MGEFLFNVDHGYLEALVRGFKTGLLTTGDYANLVQCETLEGNFIFCSIIYNFRSKTSYSIDRLWKFFGQ